MLKRVFLLLFAALVLQFCNSQSEQTDQINYATLDSLQTEVVLEIGESDDFLPGRITSLLVTRNRNILITDRDSKTIEQFDPTGNHRSTIAREGQGPGEIGTQFFYLRHAAGDTVIVNQGFSQRDYFVPDDNGIYQFLRSKKGDKAAERSFSIIGVQSESSYYGSALSTYSSANKKEGEEKDYKQSALAVIDIKGQVIQDSVQMYKEANPYIYRRSSSSISIQDIPYRFEDDLAFLPGGDYLIARIDSNAIYRYNSDHQLEEKILLNIGRRPVTSDDVAYHLGDTENPMRNEIEARIGDYKPPYLSVWATKKYILLHTNTDKAGKEMVVIDYDGLPQGKFLLPEVDDIEALKENKVYTIHRSPTKGDLIRVYKVDI